MTASDKGPSPAQELEVGPSSGPYLLVSYITISSPKPTSAVLEALIEMKCSTGFSPLNTN